MDDTYKRAGDEFPPRGTYTREELQVARAAKVGREAEAEARRARQAAPKANRRGPKPPEHAPHLPKNQRRHMRDGRRGTIYAFGGR